MAELAVGLMIDLNVVLDVVQRREPFYAASARILTRVILGDYVGFLPGHALTTLHYVVQRKDGSKRANEAIDWVLAHLAIAPQDRASFVRARSLGFEDFEDATVVSSAEAVGCKWIITRNVADFASSPVPAVTPEEYLARELREGF